jgi:peptidoglycan hydrolase-like protein with peptidoglycan-binding domain
MFVTLVAPGGANAQTSAELQAQIDALLAQIASLQAQLAGGAGSSVVCTFTRSLFLGVSGADVQCLQRYLNSAGFQVALSGAGSAGFETQYYGPLTQSAVARWQAANNVSPAVGYFGPISQAKYNALIAAGPGDDDDDEDDDEGPLEGGAGSIQEADFLSSLNSEEVGEGEEDAEVAGLEIEADEGSDIELTAVTLDFDYADTGSDDDLDEYAEEVSVWFNGEEVAREDADEFDDENSYSRTVSLDSGAIIRAGDTGELVVALTGLENIDGTGEMWNVAFEAVRFRDADGATISDSSTGDITDGNDDTTTDAGEREFSFESFASAADVELELSESSDNPDDSVVQVDTSSDTDNVLLLAGTLEAMGSDIEIESISASVTPTGTGDASQIASQYILVIDGDEVDSVNSTGCTVTGDCDGTGASGSDVEYVFSDVDMTLNEGETVDVEIRADINDIEAGSFAEGDSLTAEMDADQFSAEDETGEDLTATELSGAVQGETQTFRSQGINVELVSTDADVVPGELAGENDRGEFTIVFEVSAFDSDIYVGTSTDATGATNTDAEDGVGFAVLVDGTADAAATSSAILTCSGCDTDASTGAFIVTQGSSKNSLLR